MSNLRIPEDMGILTPKRNFFSYLDRYLDRKMVILLVREKHSPHEIEVNLGIKDEFESIPVFVLFFVFAFVFFCFFVIHFFSSWTTKKKKIISEWDMKKK